MKAVLFSGKDHPLIVKEVPKPKPTAKQVLVRLRNAALNHRDLWILQEQAAHFPDGIILGSDGSGVIESVGEETDAGLEGQEVIINPSLGWGKNPLVQSDSFRILGFPDAGTFSEYIAISRDHVFEKPEHLSFEEAAAMPLSGLTAYRALFSKARLRPGEKVLVTGIGGGAALWAMKFALAFQARVYVTSGSEAKLKQAAALGAAGGFNYKESIWKERAIKEAGGFDVIVDSAGGDQFGQLVDLAMPGGRIVIFGKTAGTIQNISPRALYWKQLSVFGTTMGTRDEFLSMLDYVHKHQLRPVIDQQFPLEQIDAAFRQLELPDRFGKIVLTISK
jgi:zinc-binding alcohol dehydrogenase/oxidoreductase